MNTRKLLQIIVFSMLVLGIGFAKDLEVFVIQPPNVTLVGVKTVALVGFKVTENNSLNWNSDFSTELSGYITSLLLKKQRGVEDVQKIFGNKEGVTFQDRIGCDIYSVLDRSSDAVFAEQLKSASGLTDSLVVEMGKMYAAQALITGDISVSYSTRNFVEEQTINKKKINVNCTELIVNTTISIRVIDTESAKVIASKTYPDPGTNTKDFQCKTKICGRNDGDPSVGGIIKDFGGLFGRWDCGDGLSDIQSIAKYHLRKAANSFAAHIAPTFALEKYDFKDPKFEGDLRKYRDSYKEARDWAKNKKLHRAYSIFKGLLEHDPFNTKLYYNIGILEEVVGNIETAHTYYTEAYNGKSDEKDYKEALIRIEKQQMFLERLAEIDVSFSTFEWNEDAGTSPNERRCKVKEAASLHEEPTEKSPVIGPAPKDREFVILAEEGEWLLLQLPFGKQGYIHSKNVEILGS